MKLNLKFYKGTDEYSDGDVEDKILEYIDKYPNNYEEAFKVDSSWPVFYHLSTMRKNVINWYPFKKQSSILEVGGGMGAITDALCQKCDKVTTIELSKRRATAILKRNKKSKNLEIIVGNFKDIELTEKYDYILLNGVLEYGAMYKDSDNPYIDFINNLKNNLKKDGKILIAIENRFGLKYWCGAIEDHTGIRFDGLNNYPDNKKIKTFSKHEFELLAKTCNMNINFYYMFPDYKFPKVIYSDEALKKGIYSNYIPYFSTTMNLDLYETPLYRDIYDNDVIPFFANSYFVELSNDESELEIQFAKFNNEFRKQEFDLLTYISKNKIYKKGLYKSSERHMDNLINIDNILNDNKIKSAKLIKKDNNLIESNFVEGQNLHNVLVDYYNNKEFSKIYEIFDKIVEIIKFPKVLSKDNNNIFDKYGIKISKNKLEKLNLYNNVIIDIVPSNIFNKDGEYIIIDQEWKEDNCPIEYAIYRSIISFCNNIDDKYNIKEQLLKKYNVIDFEYLFDKLEVEFQNSLKSDYFDYYKIYSSHVDYTRLEQFIEKNNQLSAELKNMKNELLEKDNMLNSILNSKGYKYLQKFYKLKGKIIK